MATEADAYPTLAVLMKSFFWGGGLGVALSALTACRDEVKGLRRALTDCGRRGLDCVALGSLHGTFRISMEAEPLAPEGRFFKSSGQFFLEMLQKSMFT
ncbi:hypothetical protein EYF80_052043 [Liparis tanakae]|uniref:Uncharacterized protein n=1 Tax=Liparis tanakae TaxID=230148 RepID=A0A4Z2FAG6_9TELE|nr:hypothetical protein EYF80_052043 [Liparis tanakae]